MYLISPNKKQYKANLHSHSTISDGKLTPEELKEIYRRNGYSILAITDHEAPRAHNDLTEKDFLMITGYENYIRINEDGTGNGYVPEIHLNLIARDPNNETIINYNERYCRYLDEETKKNLKKAGSEKTRKYSVEYVNEFIRTAIENGYLVTYNHPYWSMESEADILAYEGYFSMEMCNYSCYLSNRLDYNSALYDKILRAGKRVFCHSADDNHNKYPEGTREWDSCGAYTMILAEELSYDKIIKAIENGEMYSSMGPVFHEVSVEGNNIHIECSEVDGIYLYLGNRTPKHVLAAPGQSVTKADFTIDKRAQYVRVSIIDRNGKIADTRGYFRDEMGLE